MKRIISVVIGLMLVVVTFGVAVATPAGTVDYVNTNSVNGVTVLAQGRDIQSPNTSQQILFGAKIVATSSRTFQTLVFAARDSQGNNLDFGHRWNHTLGTTQQTITASRSFSSSGTYTVWVAYQIGGAWYDLTPQMTVTIGSGTPQALVVAPTAISVNEGSTNTFSVRLATQPSSNVTVSTSAASGDSDLTLQSGSSLTFTSTNWNTNQLVRVAGAEDADSTNGSRTFTVSSSGLTSINVVATEVDNDGGSSGSQPLGAGTGWTSTFFDEFDGTSLDAQASEGGSTKWYYNNCSAEADCSSSPSGTGNKGNQQLEFDRGSNCSVSSGQLDITSGPTSITSQSGTHYDWASCMITSNYALQYGFIETRMKLPSATGFWPAFWTWQAPGVNIWNETDVFEFYSDNHARLYHSQHADGGSGCTTNTLSPPGGLSSFDPSAGYHVYGADINATNTKFYIDGVLVCTASGTSNALSQILVDNFVYSQIPPSSGTTEHLLVDYVRAWTK